jgi:hypothetical protein
MKLHAAHEMKRNREGRTNIDDLAGEIISVLFYEDGNIYGKTFTWESVKDVDLDEIVLRR